MCKTTFFRFYYGPLAPYHWQIGEVVTDSEVLPYLFNNTHNRAFDASDIIALRQGYDIQLRIAKLSSTPDESLSMAAGLQQAIDKMQAERNRAMERASFALEYAKRTPADELTNEKIQELQGEE